MANPSDDLDELLDSALDDFGKIDLGYSQRSELGSGVSEDGERNQGKFTVQGLGMGLPAPRRKKKGKQKVSVESHVSEALEKLTEQTREAVKGLESTTRDESVNEGMVDDFMKQFEELTGSQSIVETMMQQLLSKEILQEPMKEIGERYPKWLEERKARLSKHEYQRFYQQHELIEELNGIYENDPGNFPKIVELMQKMQECGQPPSDIVQELAPDLDLTNLGGQLPPEVLESTSNCCIM